MSSSDAQPPLSRRQARERERAAAAGAQPVTPPPTVAAPAESPESRRRPGSHVAPAPGAPAQSARPTSAVVPGPVPTPTSASAPAVAAQSASAGPVSVPPASATEIVPGTGGLTRRQLRQLREAEGQAVQPVPLQAPTPQSSDRTVQDVLGSVDALGVPTPSETDPAQEFSAPVLDEAAVAQATEADGSPDALEPLEEAVAHSEEPRRHRSTWAPHDADQQGASADTESAAAPDVAGTDDPEHADRSDAGAVRSSDAPARAIPAADGSRAPIVAQPAVPASTPGVFPLSLDGDTNEVPVQRAAASQTPSSTPDAESDAPRVPASFQRPTEPKPLTTAFEPPVGHWSQQAHDSNDAEIHDAETGTRRVAVTNTNAIILPNSALADPTGALNATGEVILTGSIDLPASLSSTGSHRPIDGAEVDRLLEQHDEQPDTDASPVRASRAVSSHTSTRQVVLAAAKPKESRTPVILGVTVGAVGVAAAAVIIVALLTTHMGG